MDNFAKENNLQRSKTLNIKNENNKFLVKVLLKRIFETNDKSMNLITDNMLKDNFIIYTKEKIAKNKKTK